MKQPQFNDRAPIEKGSLSPPIVGSPIYECARAVYVSGFIPHATITVHANGVEVIAVDKPYFGYATIEVSRALNVGDVITATQSAFGLTSDPSIDPVVVGHQPSSLGAPQVGDTLYDCGQVVPVGQLTVSTRVDVFQSTNPAGSQTPADRVGQADAATNWTPVVTGRLHAGEYVTAVETSCLGSAHQIISPKSTPAVQVQAEPSPMTAPTVDPPVVGNDAVAARKLLIGAAVEASDDTAGHSVGGGLANAGADWVPIDPAVTVNHLYSAKQTLCTPSPSSPGVRATTAVPAPVLVSPICPDDRYVAIDNTLINAVVVLERSGAVVAAGGAVPGELRLALPPSLSFAVGDTLTVRQYCGPATISARSNAVPVINCRNVVTHKNNNKRTGEYKHETTLTPSLLRSRRFGFLCERRVNGDIYAQPLYVAGVNTKAGPRNLVFVATSTNDVYAFDADNVDPNPAAGLVWRWNNDNDPYRMLTAAEICRETRGSVGITSTPVIDPAANTMWFVTRRTFPNHNPPPGQNDGDQWLHAIDIRNGNELRNSPVRITGQVTSPRNVSFETSVQRNRPALLLNYGVLWVAFATFSCDAGDYHGWVMAYRASDLTQIGVFCTSAEGRGAGVWQSGHGLVGHDDGSVYFETGNDFGDAPARLGDSFVKLRINAAGKAIEDVGSFTPDNSRALRDGVDVNGKFIVPPARQYGTVGDTDLGSGGPVLLPGNRLIGGGKQGRLYVLDPAAMTLTQDTQRDALRILGEGFQAYHNTYPAHTQPPPGPPGPPPETWYAAGELYGPNIHGAPVYYSGTSFIYHMAEKDYMQAYPYDVPSGRLGHTQSALSTVRPADGMPGGFSSVSANGNHDGIVWCLFPRGDGMWVKLPGNLVAFDAQTLEILWSDEITNYGFAKFCPPTIAEGKVFRPTFASLIPDAANAGNADPTAYAPGALVIYGDRGGGGKRGRPIEPPSGWGWPPGLDGDDREDPDAEHLDPIERRHRHTGIWLGEPDGDADDVGDQRHGRVRRYRRVVKGVGPHNASIDVDPSQGTPTCDNPYAGAEAVLESRIYWSPQTGAHVVQAAILEHWLKQGGPGGTLGYPLDDERQAEDGAARISVFEGGVIVWRPRQGCEVRLNPIAQESDQV